MIPNIQHANRFELVYKLIVEKKAGMRPPSYLGLARAAKASHFDCPLPSFPKPVSEPVAKIRPIGICAVDSDVDATDRDETVTPTDELTELSLDLRPVAAGEDSDIEDEPEVGDEDEGGQDE